MNNALEQKIDALVLDFMAQKEIPGVTLTVVENREISYARAYGVTSLATQEPLQVSALFHHASVTKLFVGTALLQLRDRGALELDAPVIRYLPYFRLNDHRASEITIRQMLQHTSGIPDTDEFGWDQPEYDDGALERYVRSIANETLIAAPGERFFYSNIAYEVLGDVIAKVSGTTFETFVAENILQPLGMHTSTLLITEADMNLLSTPHTRYGSDGVILNPVKVTVSPIFPYNRAHGPSSTLYSNVLELSRFARAYLNGGELDGGRILNPQTVQEMWTSAVLTGKTYWANVGVGLSWFIGKRQGHRVVGHNGEDVGFSSSLVLAPDRDIGVMLLCNSDGTLIEDVADMILEVLLEQHTRTS